MVRNAEQAKTPVMCVVGAKEVEDGAHNPYLTGSKIYNFCMLYISN